VRLIRLPPSRENIEFPTGYFLRRFFVREGTQSQIRIGTQKGIFPNSIGKRRQVKDLSLEQPGQHPQHPGEKINHRGITRYSRDMPKAAVRPLGSSTWGEMPDQAAKKKQGSMKIMLPAVGLSEITNF